MKDAQKLRDIFARNLEYQLSRKGITQTDFAKSLDFPEMTVSNWINAKTYPRIDKIQQMADFFGILKSDLTEDKEGYYLPNNYQQSFVAENSSGYHVQPVTKENVIQFHHIPYFGDIAAGQLAAVEAIKESNLTYITIPRVFLDNYSEENLVAFHVNGDSMNKVFPNGSTIVGKRISDQSEVKDDDIVVYSYDGEFAVKKFRRDQEDNVLVFSPESTNKKFRDTVIPLNTINELNLIAKVIWYGVTL